MNISAEQIPWVGLLENNFDSILREWQKFSPDMRLTWPQPGREFMSAIMLFFHGKVSPFAELCPVLMKTASCLPGLRSVTYQVIQPGGHLTPHHGATSGILRVHLGIDVPEGNWIEVGGKRTYFKNGKCFAFDDSTVHEVHNESKRPRTNLIIDCWMPMSISGQRMRRIKHRFAHSIGAKRSVIADYFKETVEFAAKYKATHPELFGENEAQAGD